MSAPAVVFTIEANALGQAPAGLGLVTVVMGTSEKGAEVTPFASPVPEEFGNEFGNGPGPKLAALIALKSGNPVVFVRLHATTPGSNTAVRPGGSNVGLTVVTVTGAPFDDSYWLVECVSGGTIGTDQIVIRYSPDLGATFKVANIGTAVTYAIPGSGLTLNFTVATIAANDSYEFNSIAPLWAVGDVQDGIKSLYSQTTFYPLDIFVTGPAQESDAVAIDGYMTALSNKKIFTNVILDSVDVTWGGLSNQTETEWITALQTAWVGFEATFGQVLVGAGYYPCTNVDNSQVRRPISWFAAVRDASVVISEDWGFVDRGQLSPMPLPTSPTGQVIHDEADLPGLDGARFITATSIQTLPGLYITNPNTMAATGSDLNWAQHRHVINKLMQIMYNFFVRKLNGSIRVSKTTGFVLPQDANSLEHQCQAELDTQLINTGDVSDASVEIIRNNNILSTNQLKVTGNVVPLAYNKLISIQVGFKNPATTQV